ncbi:hypothetical protein ACFX1T_009701 [Malus domestica]
MQCATSGATKICGEDFARLDDWNCLFLRHAANEFIRDFSSDSNEQIDWPQIPQAWMGLTPMIALSIWIIIYEIIYIPQMQKKSKNETERLTMEQRFKIGIVMSVMCMVVGGLTEMKRRDSALAHGTLESPLTVALLVPQFALKPLLQLP